MLLGVEFLVLLFKAARMRADIADAALVGNSFISHGGIVRQIYKSQREPATGRGAHPVDPAVT
jgi:hypothetical protein